MLNKQMKFKYNVIMEEAIDLCVDMPLVKDYLAKYTEDTIKCLGEVEFDYIRLIKNINPLKGYTNNAKVICPMLFKRIYNYEYLASKSEIFNNFFYDKLYEEVRVILDRVVTNECYSIQEMIRELNKGSDEGSKDSKSLSLLAIIEIAYDVDDRAEIYSNMLKNPCASESVVKNSTISFYNSVLCYRFIKVLFNNLSKIDGAFLEASGL